MCIRDSPYRCDFKSFVAWQYTHIPKNGSTSHISFPFFEWEEEEASGSCWISSLPEKRSMTSPSSPNSIKPSCFSEMCISDRYNYSSETPFAHYLKELTCRITVPKYLCLTYSFLPWVLQNCVIPVSYTHLIREVASNSNGSS